MNFTYSEESSTSVEHFLRKSGVSKRLITKLKRVENGITRNGEKLCSIDSVNRGDTITIFCTDEKQLDANQSLSVPVIYEDNDFIIFDKPWGMPVHPSIKHQGDTLGNFFSSHCHGLTFRPINRLDRDTSGLVAVAKNAFAAKNMQYTIEKTYYAVVEGEITESGTIDFPIAREQESIIKRCVKSDGQNAVTHFVPITSCKKYSLLEIHLETGRTHQIRVHFSYIGHPLAGDDMYGGNISDISRQALHCGKLMLLHPVTKETMRFSADIPKDMLRLTTLINK